MLNDYKKLLGCALFLMNIFYLQAQTRLYVRATSTCVTACGGSWANAYPDLQDALSAAESNATIEEIWVAQGTYRPAVSDRSLSFDIPGDISLIGSFAGEGSDPDARSTTFYPSVLSGDLNNDDQANFGSYTDNSYHVVTTDGIGADLYVDGFTIRGGNANNTSNAKQDDGGGWYNSQYKGVSSPTISNCIFLNNRAQNDGGAFYNGGNYGTSSPVFIDCTFTGNQAKSGGACYNNGNSNVASPVFSRCSFTENEVVGSSATGGVLYSFSRAGTDNGTLYPGSVYPDFSNCIFAQNTAEGNAGALYFLADGTGGTANSVSNIENCSFYGNTASVGGAVYLNASNNGDNSATIRNSIFWNSSANTDPIFHYSSAGAGALPNINISFSLVDTDDCDNLIRDGAGSVDCSDLLFYTDPETPVFNDPENGDYHLRAESPAVNAGSNALVNSSTDFEGQMRIQQSDVDLGADEVEAVLPVDLVAFQVRAEGQQVNLRWETATELNNDFFAIEHAGDGVHFKELERVPGFGTSQESHRYQFTDLHPVSGNNYYRLRQTDLDGTFTYSEIRVASISASSQTARLYPNPVGDYLEINWTESIDTTLPYSLIDQWGREVQSGILSLQSGRARLEDLEGSLPAGIYFMRVGDQLFRLVKGSTR
ncbi:hypothetical protein CRP01_19845 [Flavilitoribacter nigricans DSM 23189 = NBRC 102662]|uniref:T9SS type A sorting domain-containing protein n=2 Tax=Flavilitoribacter TaxID=2762562 RepID=A0A2D0N8F7_FLAN2|nr:hypothetical protein CRP01_19845 [Flavilitoribacter nigricans DSM 23189 = NBRC 102662]